jgi:NADH-quinone oxidoreductase subunit N
VIVEWNTIRLLAPELVLIAAATAMFVAGAFTRSRAWWAFASLVSYLAAAAVLAAQAWPASGGVVVSGPELMDPLALAVRWLALVVGIGFTLIAARLVDEELASEYFGCLMLVAAGMMITAWANELILLFLGLELLSIPTYVLLFLGRRDRASGEATMKYFYLSILSSALLLYGFSFLYGLAGTTTLAGTPAAPGIREALASPSVVGESPLGPLLPLALVLVLAGLGFRLAIAPLQFYAPDVYQGTTSANAGLLAVAPKIAGVVGMIRLVVVAMPAAADMAWQFALILAILTMTIGNVCALWQRNIRRLLAYSSIAHGGYLLIGLAAAAAAKSAGGAYRGGIAAMLFYVLVYALATMGAFAALAYLGSSRRDVNDVEELSGVARSQPAVAGALAIFMFSLAGLPPLAGFWGKLNLFGSAIELAVGAPRPLGLWFTILSVAGALNAAIAAAYYLRVIAVMYFQPAVSPVQAAGGRSAWLAAVISAGLVVVVGALPGRPLNLAIQSEAVLRPENRTVLSPGQSIENVAQVAPTAAGEKETR